MDQGSKDKKTGSDYWRQYWEFKGEDQGKKNEVLGTYWLFLEEKLIKNKKC